MVYQVKMGKDVDSVINENVSTDKINDKVNKSPSWLSPGIAAFTVKNTMGKFYGYTPADAAQDLKSAEGTVLLKYDGTVKTIINTYYFKNK